MSSWWQNAEPAEQAGPVVSAACDSASLASRRLFTPATHAHQLIVELKAGVVTGVMQHAPLAGVL